MYLGEVNVLQNELPALIKAAECLRIKGLAVPDESPPPQPQGGRGSQELSKSRDEGSPHAKRRRPEEGCNCSNLSPPRKKTTSRPQLPEVVTDAANSEDLPKIDKVNTREKATPEDSDTQQISTSDLSDDSSLPVTKDDQQEQVCLDRSMPSCWFVFRFSASTYQYSPKNSASRLPSDSDNNTFPSQ